jgi:hypothetical protein
VSAPLARYIPSRRYAWLTLFAILGALFSAWMGERWAPSWIAAGLFTASAMALAVMALRPAVEIHETHLLLGGRGMGRRAIAWSEIRRVDQAGWSSPLALYLTLAPGERILLLYPGDLEGCASLLRHIRRFSRSALLDGVPYRQFWGEPPTSAKSARETVQKYPVLPPEEEEEIERMLQRLKTAGHIDSRSSDEK